MKKTTIGSGKSFAIGPMTVEPSQNLIRHESAIFALEPKIMDVLEYLAVNQGSVCSRDNIITAVWNVEFGADESLTRAISVIRKTFRKAGGRGQYIQTISKRGYILQEAVSGFVTSKPETLTVVELPAANLKKEVIPGTKAPSLTEVPSSIPPPSISRPIQKQKTKFVPLFLGFAVATALGMGLVGLSWQKEASPTTFGGELAVSPFGRSVAVLPFVDLSADKNHQYFSDGIAEELSNELAKIDALRIVGQRLGGSSNLEASSYQEIGNKLKVSHIIHGSVRKQGERVRITTQLINTEDNSHAWSSSYDGTFDNIFELQERVSFDVVTELSLLLSLEFDEPVEFEGLMPTTLVPDTK